MSHAENKKDRLGWQKNKELENEERDKFSKKLYRHNKNKRKIKNRY